MIKLLYFGRLSDVATGGDIAFPDGVKDVRGLAAHLSAGDLTLSEALARKGNRVAVNQVLVGWDATLQDGDEVAFMSPLSGG